jgi:hypothetical protein
MLSQAAYTTQSNSKGSTRNLTLAIMYFLRRMDLQKLNGWGLFTEVVRVRGRVLSRRGIVIPVQGQLDRRGHLPGHPAGPHSSPAGNDSGSRSRIAANFAVYQYCLLGATRMHVCSSGSCRAHRHSYAAGVVASSALHWTGSRNIADLIDPPKLYLSHRRQKRALPPQIGFLRCIWVIRGWER